MSKIFISYRRSDSEYVTGWIYDRLTTEFGKDEIFKDVDNIPLGVDFRTHLDQAISQCKICLCVIGQDWLDARDNEGNRRLELDQDFVRIELESALSRNIPVIPLLVRGARMPSPQQLPQSLQALAFRNGTVVRSAPDFHRDMDRLIAGIDQHFDNPPQPAPQPAPQTPSPKPIIATASR